MSFIKCYDVVSMVICEASERFAPLWVPEEEKIDILKQYCDGIDALAREFSGVSFDVEVDEISMAINITLECGEIIIESESHILYELMRRSSKFGICAAGKDNLSIQFSFPSIWGKS